MNGENDLLSPNRNVLAELLRNYVQPNGGMPGAGNVSPYAPQGLASAQAQAKPKSQDQMFADYLGEVQKTRPEEVGLQQQGSVAGDLRNTEYQGRLRDSGRFLSAPPEWATVAPVLGQIAGLYGQNKAGQGLAGLDAKRMAAALKGVQLTDESQ